MNFTSCIKIKNKPLKFKAHFKGDKNRIKFYFNTNNDFIGLNYKFKTPFKQYDNLLIPLKNSVEYAIFYIDTNAKINKKYEPYCIDEMLKCQVSLSEKEKKKINELVASIR